MPAPPRAAVSMLILLAVALTPSALADDCVTTQIANHADGLGLTISPMGDTLLLAFKTGVPGDGIYLRMLISPVDCGGIGVGTGGNGVMDPFAVLDTLPVDIPTLVPLP